MSKLLPCPFCGSKDIDPAFWEVAGYKGPGCKGCGAIADSAEKWNRRSLSTFAIAETYDMRRPSRADYLDALQVTVCRGSILERLHAVFWLLTRRSRSVIPQQQNDGAP